ncbi:hypothetical protein L2E82_51954 [Cichorium intybus]|nr:hypothetical protein L2E82_51954 [Cichorium intybus]
MTWGKPTRDGTPVSRQQTPTSQPFSQPQPVLFKPQPTFQHTQPIHYQQPSQPQYHYPETEERYDEEDEGWVPPAPQPQWNRGRGPPRRAPRYQPPPGQQEYNDHLYGNPAQPLHFAQPRRQSVASHFQPREYDDSSLIYIPDNIDSQVEIRPQLLRILPEFTGYKQDDPYNHLYEFLAIANANNPRNIFRLRLFPFTLKDKAKYWFTSLPSNSITTWDQLKPKFLQEFYPARVSETHQAMINASSSGTFMWQDLEEAWQFLDQLSNGSKANFSTRKTVGMAAAVGADANWKKEVKKEISELNKKFDRLMSTLQNGPQNPSQGGQGGPKTQENNYQSQSTNQPRTHQPANNNNHNGNTNGNSSNSNNRGPNNVTNNVLGTQEEMIAKMYEMVTATQQQSQANAKAIANMERQIRQMAEDQQKRDSGKFPSATEVNPTHNQRPGKEQVNTVESRWRKVTLEDLFEVGSEVKLEKEEKVLGSEEGKEEGVPVGKETQPEIYK